MKERPCRIGDIAVGEDVSDWLDRGLRPGQTADDLVAEVLWRAYTASTRTKAHTVLGQRQHARALHDELIYCPECRDGAPQHSADLYRCFYCGQFYCESHAPAHFGAQAELEGT